MLFYGEAFPGFYYFPARADVLSVVFVVLAGYIQKNHVLMPKKEELFSVISSFCGHIEKNIVLIPQNEPNHMKLEHLSGHIQENLAPVPKTKHPECRLDIPGVSYCCNNGKILSGKSAIWLSIASWVLERIVNLA